MSLQDVCFNKSVRNSIANLPEVVWSAWQAHRVHEVLTSDSVQTSKNWPWSWKLKGFRESVYIRQVTDLVHQRSRHRHVHYIRGFLSSNIVWEIFHENYKPLDELFFPAYLFSIPWFFESLSNKYTQIGWLASFY